MRGSAGADLVNGTTDDDGRADLLNGFGGNDSLYAHDGVRNDSVYGGDGYKDVCTGDLGEIKSGCELT